MAGWRVRSQARANERAATVCRALQRQTTSTATHLACERAGVAVPNKDYLDLKWHSAVDDCWLWLPSAAEREIVARLEPANPNPIS